MTDTTFLIGLLDSAPGAFVAAEDLHGPHVAAIRHWQDLGFLAREPSAHPTPGCPHCGAGVPHHVADRLLCDRCFSVLEPPALLAWAFRPQAFFHWFATEAGLHGELRQLDPATWQLGTVADPAGRTECFFRGRGALTPAARSRLSAYRRVLVFFGQVAPLESVPPTARQLSLLDVLSHEGRLTMTPFAPLLRPGGAVRFDTQSGALWLGDDLLGEVPMASREHAFLAALAREIDAFLPYRDLKQSVLRQTGSMDTTDEATFCQKLKSRIKGKWVPRIDAVSTTSNKGDGYRLRGHTGV
jgi:hypothetical protein